MMMNHHNPPMIGCSATMKKLRGEKAQPKLLHVTETLTVDRIGGRTPIPVDFRLRNVVKRGVFTGKTEWIRQEDLPFDVAQRLATPLSKLADHDEQLRELSHQ